jgi:hypothetical protein
MKYIEDESGVETMELEAYVCMPVGISLEIPLNRLANFTQHGINADYGDFS